jgi:hypothetical protein
MNAIGAQSRKIDQKAPLSIGGVGNVPALLRRQLAHFPDAVRWRDFLGVAFFNGRPRNLLLPLYTHRKKCSCPRRTSRRWGRRRLALITGIPKSSYASTNFWFQSFRPYPQIGNRESYYLRRPEPLTKYCQTSSSSGIREGIVSRVRSGSGIPVLWQRVRCFGCRREAPLLYRGDRCLIDRWIKTFEQSQLADFTVFVDNGVPIGNLATGNPNSFS